MVTIELTDEEFSDLIWHLEHFDVELGFQDQYDDTKMLSRLRIMGKLRSIPVEDQIRIAENDKTRGV